MPLPPENLPARNMSVHGFCRHARTLLEQDHARFVRFVLTGQDEDRQAVIDPILNTLSDDEDITVRRDYDSVLGIHDDIVVSSPINIYPVAKKEDTLSKNIHVKYHFTTTAVCLHLSHTTRLSRIFH
jgi:hypothetical protein